MSINDNQSTYKNEVFLPKVESKAKSYTRVEKGAI